MSFALFKLFLGVTGKNEEIARMSSKSNKVQGISKINSSKKTMLDNMKLNNYYSTKISQKSKKNRLSRDSKTSNENEIKEIDKFLELISLIKYGYFWLLFRFESKTSKVEILKNKIWNGLNETERKYFWIYLTQFPLNKWKYLGLYDCLKNKESPFKTEIENDVCRTPVPIVNLESTRKSLYTILSCYSLYNLKVGYVQGMNYIVATLLLHFKNEEDTFWILDSIMTSYGLEELYDHEFKKLKSLFVSIERSIEYHLPDVYKHFELSGISVELFWTQWLITLFTSDFLNYWEKFEINNASFICENDEIPFYSIDENFTKYSMIIIEFFICGKWEIFNHIVLKIMNLTKQQFIHKDTEETLRIIKNYHTIEGFKFCDYFKEIRYYSTNFYEWNKSIQSDASKANLSSRALESNHNSKRRFDSKSNKSNYNQEAKLWYNKIHIKPTLLKNPNDMKKWIPKDQYYDEKNYI